METRITARQAGTLMQQQALSPSLLKQKEILSLLTRCSIRRASPQNPASLAIYVQDLSSYSLEVIEPVLEKFGGEVPEEYKPVWPASGVFTEMMRGHIRANRSAELKAAKDKQDEEYRLAAIREMEEDRANPEEWDRQLAAAAEKLGMGRKPKETCTELVCPGCGLAQPVAGNIRLWTPQQLRDHADVLEELAVIADRNRNIPRLPLSDVVEEVA